MVMNNSLKLNSMVLIFASLFAILSCNSPSENGDSGSFKNINAEESKQMIDENSKNDQFIILDTRTTGEYKQGHIQNSVFLDFSAKDFYTKVAALDKEKSYLIYCHSGGRSGITMDYMKKNGFKEAWNMSGGIVSWSRSGFKLTK